MNRPPKTAKIISGLNYSVYNSRVTLTRRAVMNNIVNGIILIHIVLVWNT